MAQSTFLDFLREQLPPPPARVLDVGCGQGELTTALAAAGYDAIGIDPNAPQGGRFRRIRLEDVDPAEDGPFDAVVASLSLHHIRDLDQALDRVAALLAPGGVLVADEFGWDLADDATFEWLHGQRRVLAAAGQGTATASVAAEREEWESSHLGLHGFVSLRRELDERFDERAFEWAPFLHRLFGGVATEVLESALVDAGAIRALGFRYAGVVRTG